jgi:hypothetical protein
MIDALIKRASVTYKCYEMYAHRGKTCNCLCFEIVQEITQDSDLNGVFTQDSDLNDVFTQDSDLNVVFTQDSDLNGVFTQDFDLNNLFTHDSDLNGDEMYAHRGKNVQLLVL